MKKEGGPSGRRKETVTKTSGCTGERESKPELRRGGREGRSSNRTNDKARLNAKEREENES